MSGQFRKMQARFTIHHGSCWSWDALVSPLSSWLATLPAAVHICCKSEHNVGKWCHTNRADPWHNRAGLNINVNSCTKITKSFFFWDKKDMFCFVWVMLLSINVSFLLKYRPNVLTWKTSNLLSSTWKIVICWRLCLLHLDWQIIAAKWNEMEWIGAYRKGRFPLTDFSVHQWPSRWYVMTRHD